MAKGILIAAMNIGNAKDDEFHDPKKIALMGVSMGGYGALRLAFKYPDVFAAVSAQMPALITDLPNDLSSGAPGSPACCWSVCRVTAVPADYCHCGQPEAVRSKR